MSSSQVQQAGQAASHDQEINIGVLTDRLVAGVEEGRLAIIRLEAWEKTVDRESYQKIHPWTEEMKAAHLRYHELGDMIHVKHEAYDELSQKYRNKLTTERRNELARLAVAWGQQALMYVLLTCPYLQ
jgi:hypothetical protein